MKSPREPIETNDVVQEEMISDHCGLNDAVSLEALLGAKPHKSGLLCLCCKSNHVRACVFERVGEKEYKKLNEVHVGLTGVNCIRTWINWAKVAITDWLVAQGELIEKSQKAEEGCGCQE